MEYLNDNQLKLLAEYCSQLVLNNQEVHPSDMPHVAKLFHSLASQGFTINESQIENICLELHSLASPNKATSERLSTFLSDMVLIFQYALINDSRWKLDTSLHETVNNIINEKE